MRELVNLIFKFVLEAKEIPEELLYEFSKQTAEIVQNGCTEIIPKEFWELESYVDAYWRGHQYIKSDNNIQIYQMGQLLSFTNMLSMLAEEMEKESSIEDYAARLKDGYGAIKEIQEHPGITRKELEQTAGMNGPSLAQLINELKWNGFLQPRSMGQEKHYYLTKHGQQLCSAMEVKYEKPMSPCFMAHSNKTKASVLPVQKISGITLSVKESPPMISNIYPKRLQAAIKFQKRLPDSNNEMHFPIIGENISYKNLQNYNWCNMNENSYGCKIERSIHGKTAKVSNCKNRHYSIT